MKKLVLNLESLEIASFETTAAASDRGGTVHANNDENTMTCSGQLICMSYLMSYFGAC